MAGSRSITTTHRKRDARGCSDGIEGYHFIVRQGRCGLGVRTQNDSMEEGKGCEQQNLPTMAQSAEAHGAHALPTREL
jgi:hypothetical protein